MRLIAVYCFVGDYSMADGNNPHLFYSITKKMVERVSSSCDPTERLFIFWFLELLEISVEILSENANVSFQWRPKCCIRWIERWTCCNWLPFPSVNHSSWLLIYQLSVSINEISIHFIDGLSNVIWIHFKSWCLLLGLINLIKVFYDW